MANITAITADEFKDRRWIPFTNFKFAAQDLVCPITAQEVPNAQMGSPLGFIRIADEYKLVTLQGLTPAKNLLVDDKYRWRGQYIPHAYQCHPFLLVESEGQHVLCVNENSEMLCEVGAHPDAEAFFDADNKPTEKVEGVIKFLGKKESERKGTAEICALLDKHQLIKPWEAEFKTNAGDIALSEFYCIDEEALNKLSTDALKELFDQDAILAAYGQLFSMFNIGMLGRLVQQEPDAGKQEISFGAGSDDLLNFDNI